MSIFIVLWPNLLTTKLRSVIRHNLGHSTVGSHFCVFVCFIKPAYHQLAAARTKPGAVTSNKPGADTSIQPGADTSNKPSADTAISR